MKDYVLFSDATLDLPGDVVEQLEIQVIPMTVNQDGTEFAHYPDCREMPLDTFYANLKNGSLPVTSQITPAMYEELFTPWLKEGKDILYICFSSGLSGTYQSSVVAAQMLMDRYPERKIVSIDSLSASVGEGLLVYLAGQKYQEGMALDDLARWVNENRMKVEHWFTVEDLFHLNRGGRLSAVSAVVGTALKIKPVLSVDEEGRLFVAAKQRGQKKAWDHMIGRLKEQAIDPRTQTVIVGHANCPESAEKLKEMLLEQGLVKDVLISQIGPVIGTHVGSGMLALVFMGRSRLHD